MGASERLVVDMAETKGQRRRWIVVSVAGCLLAALASLRPVAANQGSVLLRVDPATSNVAVNEEFLVTLEVEAGSQPLDTVDAFLSFDPALLQALELIPGGALPTLLASSIAHTAGRIGYSAGKALGGDDAAGDSVLATLRLRARSEPTPTGTALSFVAQPPSQSTDAFYRGLSVLQATHDGLIQVGPAAPPGVDYRLFLPLIPR